jgi:serine protease SohB
MLADYLIFLAKTATLALAILIVILGIVTILGKGKERAKEKLYIKKLNDKYKQMARMLRSATSDKSALKKWLKSEKKLDKGAKKDTSQSERKRIFVLDFNGDIKATAVKTLREEITALLTLLTPQDEVLVRLESMGGMVHAYGLAASQLRRLRQAQIPLTIAVDKVAASGGYMMACVGNKILAAPFSIIGSIGVIAQLPNFNRWLRKNDVEFEQIIAGEYKRTISVFGENTKKGREKMQEEVEETQVLFKNFVVENRPKVDIQQVATGEHWFGTDALKLKLVDELLTSDSYLLEASQHSDIYEVSYHTRKSFLNKLGIAPQTWMRQRNLSKLNLV